MEIFVRESGRTADPSAAPPRIPVEICGVDALHAPFFAERRTAALSSATWQESGSG